MHFQQSPAGASSQFVSLSDTTLSFASLESGSESEIGNSVLGKRRNRSVAVQMTGNSTARRTSGSNPSNKSTVPSVIIEPSVPAACASLLSLRSGRKSPTVPSNESASEGHLPMLRTALSVIEGCTRGNPLPIPSAKKDEDLLSGDAGHVGFKKHLRKNDSGAGQVQKRTNGSRFWDTVLSETAGASVARRDLASSKSLIMGTSPVPSGPLKPSSTNETSSDSDASQPKKSPEKPSSSQRSLSGDFPRSTKPALSSIPSEATLSSINKANAPSSDEDETNKMNILCVVCQVRFRKQGHLNMHWRSVHATPADSVYPAKLHARSLGASSQRKGNEEKPRIKAEHDTSGKVSKSRGLRPYGCPQCASRFRRGSDRNRHMRMVHAKIRPFECTQCGSHFGRKSFLEAHISTVHEKQRPFRCECGAAFGQRSSLTRHAKKIHGQA